MPPYWLKIAKSISPSGRFERKCFFYLHGIYIVDCYKILYRQIKKNLKRMLLYLGSCSRSGKLQLETQRKMISADIIFSLKIYFLTLGIMV